MHSAVRACCDKRCRKCYEQLCCVQVHAFGFVANMHEFMACSDAIITKAGAALRLLPCWPCCLGLQGDH